MRLYRFTMLLLCLAGTSFLVYLFVNRLKDASLRYPLKFDENS